MRIAPIVSLCVATLASVPIAVAQSRSVYGTVVDASNGETLPFVAVAVVRDGDVVTGSATDADGRFVLSALDTDSVMATCLGYEPLYVAASSEVLTLKMSKTTISLAEVRVTAAEVETARTSTSLIGNTAMAHLQPTSLTDIMALIPGGLSAEPDMSRANVISIREIPSTDKNYNTTAIGTQVNIDGAPIGTDADINRLGDDINMVGDVADKRYSAGRGVDMRNIATDDIESVEVIRGIPSVRYGDVTSGVVNIHRRTGGAPLTVRLKVDTKSRLVSVGKGFGLPAGWTLAADAGFLSSRNDPRNKYETFQRVNLSLRARKNWHSQGGFSLTWNPSADFSKNIDERKQDPEIQINQEDSFKSGYTRFSFGNMLKFSLGDTRATFRNSISFSHDEIKQTSRVLLTTYAYAALDTTDGLPHDATPLAQDYVARHDVDGRPFYANTQLSLSHSLTTGPIDHDLGIGFEWQLNKNFGRGQVFDPQRPLSGSTTHRPRSFRSIPPTNIVGYWLEEEASAHVGRVVTRLTVGIRFSQMAGLADEYAMRGKVYVDPRLMLTLELPKAGEAQMNVSLGWGSLRKMPTMDMLNPEIDYVDVYEMNYWNSDASLRRAIVRTYPIDRNAYDIEPAQNNKIEGRISVHLAGHALSFTAFRENMEDAFRRVKRPMSLYYDQYDLSNYDPTTGVRPNPTLLPSTPRQRLVIAGRWENESTILKEGVEWTYETPRLPVIATRLNVMGAWLKTTRHNSSPEWKKETQKTVGGVVIDDHYAGLYREKTIKRDERVSTTFTVESFFDRIDFIFSATAECVWKSVSDVPLANATPVAYVADDAVVKPYTDAEAQDKILSHLILKNTADRLSINDRAYATFNFKATKRFGPYFTISFFADRLLAAAKDYETKDGFVVRRSFSSYFGTQAVLKF